MSNYSFLDDVLQQTQEGYDYGLQLLQNYVPINYATPPPPPPASTSAHIILSTDAPAGFTAAATPTDVIQAENVDPVTTSDLVTILEDGEHDPDFDAVKKTGKVSNFILLVILIFPKIFIKYFTLT